MARWLEQLEQLVGGGPAGPKRVRAMRWLLLLGAAGIGLMLVNSFLELREVPAQLEMAAPPAEQAEPALLGMGQDAELSPFRQLEKPLEERLKEILEKIVGVGTVDVLITIEGTEELVLGQHEKQTQQATDETDASGGKRHITSTTRDGQVVLYEASEGQTPLVTKRISPRIRGIVIVARGAENPTVRRLLLEAAAKGYDVETSRISVVPRKQP